MFRFAIALTACLIAAPAFACGTTTYAYHYAPAPVQYVPVQADPCQPAQVQVQQDPAPVYAAPAPVYATPNYSYGYRTVTVGIVHPTYVRHTFVSTGFHGTHVNFASQRIVRTQVIQQTRIVNQPRVQRSVSVQINRTVIR